MGAIKEPNNFKALKKAKNKPDATITLDYVFGYRAKDCRNNLFYTSSGKILYNAAGKFNYFVLLFNFYIIYSSRSCIRPRNQYTRIFLKAH